MHEGDQIKLRRVKRLWGELKQAKKLRRWNSLLQLDTIGPTEISYG